MDPISAQRALSVEHTIDGRRCEAKIALPKVQAAERRAYMRQSPCRLLPQA